MFLLDYWLAIQLFKKKKFSIVMKNSFLDWYLCFAHAYVDIEFV